ncbi:MAG: NAD-dependent epimerase/dehydratase family protein [bacterium]|nr:NAD-dependent epimerase/dehydratase family protein [bacterium]
MGIYRGKRVLVTGGTGMIGRFLVELLLEEGAIVYVVSLDDPVGLDTRVIFKNADLRYFDICLEITKGIDYVFHLAGVKGSPKMALQKPASFFVPLIMMNTNIIEASRLNKVEVFSELDMWKSFPSKNDWFAGWAKRMGELQIEAYKIQYGLKNFCIVRPANVYGPYDNFDPESAMVIPSLIKRAVDGEDPLIVWGDGSQIRDFIHAKDVARGMLLVLEKLPENPVNISSGKGVTIKEIVGVIINNLENKPKVVWDTNKPVGDKIRLMDNSYAKYLGFMPEISIEEGIRETIEWYKKNKDILTNKYNAFKEKSFLDY